MLSEIPPTFCPPQSRESSSIVVPGIPCPHVCPIPLIIIINYILHITRANQYYKVQNIAFIC